MSPDTVVILDPNKETYVHCTYCGGLDHNINMCGIYERHHEFGTPLDMVRDMVLARRQAKMFGGIPEEYLKHPTKEQEEKAREYRHNENEREKAYLKHYIQTVILPERRKNENI